MKNNTVKVRNPSAGANRHGSALSSPQGPRSPHGRQGLMSYLHSWVLALLISGNLFWVGCTTVPETGRRALSLYPDHQVSAAAAVSFEDMKQTVNVSNSTRLHSRLERVGTRIVQSAVERGTRLPPPHQWEFVVFDDEQVNAFAMPGGKVGFYTGIIRLFDSDDEMAVVMGHEVAHVAAKHGNERLSTQSAIQLGGVALNLATRDQDESTRQVIMTAFGLGSQFGIALPFSRRDETEADEIGLIYMANAGYDPRAAITFWQKMAASKGQQVPQFLSTHPSDANRIARLRALMPKAMKIYNFKTNERASLGPVYTSADEWLALNYEL